MTHAPWGLGPHLSSLFTPMMTSTREILKEDLVSKLRVGKGAQLNHSQGKNLPQSLPEGGPSHPLSAHF